MHTAHAKVDQSQQTSPRQQTSALSELELQIPASHAKVDQSQQTSPRQQTSALLELEFHGSVKIKSISPPGTFYFSPEVGARYYQLHCYLGGASLQIRVCAKDGCAQLKSAGSLATGLVTMNKVVLAQLSSSLASTRARIPDGRACVRARVCGAGVIVKVKTMALCERMTRPPTAVFVVMKPGIVYLKGFNADGFAVTLTKVKQVKGLAAEAAVGCKSQVAERMAATAVPVLARLADQRALATFVSAVSGAAVFGVSGGAAGLVAGGALGAACGVPAAFFTFGLSIPLGAAIVGGSGLCGGAIAGGATGLVVGGTAGHKLHQKRENIADGIAVTLTKVKQVKGFAAEASVGCKSQVAECMTATEAPCASTIGRLCQEHGRTAQS